MRQRAVIVFGPPGSGKGTQADLLTMQGGFIHFDTGKHIERVVHDPESRKNKIIQRERRNFDTGILCTPSWVLGIVTDQIKRLAASNLSVVFSGSPRTLYEAAGDAKRIGVIEALTRNYGKRNVFVFLLKIKPGSSLARNGSRLVCSVCKRQVLAAARGTRTACPFCAGKLVRRTLDKPEVIRVRLEEYKSRTKPILKEFRKRGFAVRRIDGEQAPWKVHRDIVRKLEQ